eukprot:TRINITY_DN3712_c1_g1_i1.p1 TRINITY_DN3712_c1_g1~~TRINITY_DN3712_c1_g1_i1.p1  ORF type:complete len:284 (+),score=22.00 TRINITY_DN3712_c1_g1_i1:36-854(+)
MLSSSILNSRSLVCYRLVKANEKGIKNVNLPKKKSRNFNAMQEGAQQYFSGTYGPWTVEESDKLEVLSYRTCLTISASAFLLNVVASTLLEQNQTVQLIEDGLAVAGGLSLGAALQLIHIYVTPIKRFIQALWALGMLGGTVLLIQQDSSLVKYVFDNPSALWGVGPLFAAVTGLSFKEGVCYGKAECGVLTLLVPIWCLGHLTGLAPHSFENVEAWLVAALLMVFATRKFSQPIHEDIGDKSIFEFQKMSQEEQEQLLQKLQATQMFRQND